MLVESAVISHEGKIRINNEDNFFLNGVFKKNTDIKRKQEEISEKGNKFLFSVCDGMGGGEYGEVASFCAVKALARVWKGEILPEQFLEEAVFSMEAELEGKECEDVGTTISILYLENEMAQLFHLGDSRVYLFRENVLVQLSRDHTQAQLMIEHGILDRKEARMHKGGHALTRYLGIDIELSTEDFYHLESFKVNKGDIFLLCSDGLTDMLVDEEIEESIQRNKKKTAGILVNDLAELALQAGGKDNVTCMIVKIKGLGKKGIFESLKRKYG